MFPSLLSPAKIAAMTLASVIAIQIAPAAFADNQAQDLGQSDWISPAAGGSNMSSSRQAENAFAPSSGKATISQSDWISPAAGGSNMSSSRQAENTFAPLSGKATISQSDWISPSGGQAANNPIGQSDWINTGAIQPKSCANNALSQSDWTGAPANLAGNAVSKLKGTVSRADQADMSPLDGGGMSGSIEAGNLETGNPAQDAQAPQSMEEMIGNIMMIPMALAASTGLFGQSFHTYGPVAGGFRTYGPGGGLMSGNAYLMRSALSNLGRFGHY